MSRERLRSSSPAPASRISASATSDTTNTLRARLRCTSVEPARGPSFRGSLGEVRAACKAGTVPNSTPVNSATSVVNASTRKSIDTPSSGTRLGGAALSKAFVLHHASSNRPTAAPMNAIRQLSVRICRTTRRAPAPTAMRMPISCLRAAALARKEYCHVGARDEQHQPYGSLQVAQTGRDSPTNCARNGTRFTVQFFIPRDLRLPV